MNELNSFLSNKGFAIYIINNFSISNKPRLQTCCDTGYSRHLKHIPKHNKQQNRYLTML